MKGSTRNVTSGRWVQLLWSDRVSVSLLAANSNAFALWQWDPGEDGAGDCQLRFSLIEFSSVSGTLCNCTILNLRFISDTPPVSFQEQMYRGSNIPLPQLLFFCTFDILIPGKFSTKTTCKYAGESSLDFFRNSKLFNLKCLHLIDDPIRSKHVSSLSHSCVLN